MYLCALVDICAHMFQSVRFQSRPCAWVMYEVINVEVIRDSFHSFPYALINSYATASPAPSNSQWSLNRKCTVKLRLRSSTVWRQFSLSCHRMRGHVIINWGKTLFFHEAGTLLMYNIARKHSGAWFFFPSYCVRLEKMALPRNTGFEFCWYANGCAPFLAPLKFSDLPEEE